MEGGPCWYPGAVPVAFSPGGQSTAVGMGGKRDGFATIKGWDLKLWEAVSGRETHSVQAVEQDLMNCIAFSPNGKYIAAGSWYGVKAWEMATGKILWSHAGAQGAGPPTRSPFPRTAGM